MNPVVEEPSKIIKMKIGSLRCHEDLNPNTEIREDEKTKEIFVSESGFISTMEESECAVTNRLFSKHILCKSESYLSRVNPDTKNLSIDFFNLNEPDTALYRKNRLQCKVYNTESNMESQTQNGMDKLVFKEDFIKIALRNDIRVKNARYIEGLAFVYFYTLDDSISFYRQFSPYADLCFSHKYDFEQISLISSSEQSECMFDDFLVYEDFLDENFVENVHDNRSYSRIAEESPFNTSLSGATKGVFPEPKAHLQFSSYNSDLKSTKPSQEIIFEKKVEYFLNLRNFFSKGDIKAMTQSLEMGNTEFVFRNTKELAVGNQSNKIMQEAIKLLSDLEVARVIENLGHDIAPIAANKHGAYTIQMLISASKTALTQSLLSKYFKEFGGLLITHEIGNYTIQKVLRFDPDLVFDFFISNIASVVNSELGIKVLKRCLEFFSDKKLILFEKAQECTDKDLENVLL